MTAMQKFAASPDLVVLLARDIEKILGRISGAHLRRYAALLADLAGRDVHLDRDYQRVFKGFYKMAGREEGWYEYYFGLLQRNKHNKSITFREVLEEIYAERAQVEPSFSSKLVATIRPEMPICDKHVMANLCLEAPPQHWPAGKRLPGILAMYAVLEGKVAALVHDPVFAQTLRPAFDRRHPGHMRISDVKKLDLLLWQHRRMCS